MIHNPPTEVAKTWQCFAARIVGLVVSVVAVSAVALVGSEATAMISTRLSALDGRTQNTERKADTARTDKRPTRSAVRELQRDIDGILASRDFNHANIGVSVVSAESGEVLYRMNDERMFVPASTLKLFTTAAALESLGKDFRYSTRLYLDGNVSSGGEFRGNMLIRGSGDPTWSAFFKRDALAILDSWVAKLDSLGITGVRGAIVVDDSYFDNEQTAPGWMIDDVSYAYSPHVSALNAYDNTVELRLAPGREIGAGATCEVFPDRTGVRVDCHVRTIAMDEPDEVRAVRKPGSNDIRVDGTIAGAGAGDTTRSVLRVTVEDPSQYVGTLLKNALEHHGLRVRAEVTPLYSALPATTEPSLKRKSYAEMDPVCETFSPPLSEIINVINTHSHNLCAEALIKTIGKESSSMGSWESGTEAVKKFLAQKGMQQDDFIMVDGSGLSRLNLCAPSQLTYLLTTMLKSPSREHFLNSLAVPGAPGTLKNRVVGTLAEKHLKAKTGSMNNVSNIAGYVTTRDNETLCFAIMLNNYTVPDALARSLQDVVCMRLASFTRKAEK